MYDLLYHVDGLCYRTKVDAFIAAKGRWDKVSGSIWNNKLYTSYNWKVEPKESYLDLLRDRALQIREKYSHITMLFSGGYDSYTMIRTFYENNIHIDRVTLGVTYGGHRSNSFWDEPSNIEWKTLTLPLMKHFEKLMPKTVFEYNFQNNLEFLDDFERYFKMTGVHPHIKFPYFINEEAPHDNQKNIYLYGDLEPDLSYIDGKIYFTLWDTSNIEYNANSLNGVSFFTHPDFPKLHAKQCHLLKNYFIEHTLIDRINDLQFKTDIKNLLTRYTHILHYHYAVEKAQTSTRSLLGLKHELLYNSLTPEYQRKYRDLISYKIKGVPLWQMKYGIKVFEVEV